MRINLRDDDEAKPHITLKKKKFSYDLTNVHYCITGKIPGYTRAQFAQHLRTKFNATMDRDVMYHTKILIIGTDPGKDKQREAGLKNVPTIQFAKFRDEYLNG